MAVLNKLMARGIVPRRSRGPGLPARGDHHAGPIVIDFDSTAATVIAVAFGAGAAVLGVGSHLASRRRSGTSCAPLTWLQSGHGCPGGGAAPGRRRGGRRRLAGGVKWTADGCEAAAFTAAVHSRHRWELAAVDSRASSEATMAHLLHMSSRRLVG
jgi:hypothetical protein